MSDAGLTRICTIAPILDLLDSAGGSAARVFRRVDLSPRLIENPSGLMLLRDQFALLEGLAREIGDPAAATRLAMAAGVNGLGSYGYLIASQPTLRDAMRVAETELPLALQTSTVTALKMSGPHSSWTYRVIGGPMIGRRQNELLALGYILGLLRRFGGPKWVPLKVSVPGPPLEGRSSVEDLFGCSIETGALLAVSFGTDMLDWPNRAPVQRRVLDPMPNPQDPLALIEQAILSGLGDRRPDLAGTAQRLGVGRRTLQRYMKMHEMSFERLLDRVLRDRALAMLCGPATLTEIAYALGFSDAAHFSRAFRRWVGAPPNIWRRQNTLFSCR